jgi:hypothetical protein
MPKRPIWQEEDVRQLKVLRQTAVAAAIILAVVSLFSSIQMATGALGGAALGQDFTISVARGAQQEPRIAYSQNADQYLVVWQDFREETSSRIYGQRITGGGGIVGGNLPIGEEGGNQYLPSVAYNEASSEFLVVWGDDRGLSLNGRDIYGQRIADNGVLLGSNFLISGGGRDQSQAVVVYNPNDNEYLVVWTDRRGYEDSGLDIWGQRVSAGGELLGDNFVISGTPGDQQRPATAIAVAANHYLVAWYGQLPGDVDYNIRGQMVKGDGSLLGGSFTISSATGSQFRPAIAYNSNDREFLILWYDLRNGSEADIYGQRVSDDGTLLGGSVEVVREPGNQFSPDLAYNPDKNNYRTVWKDGWTLQSLDIRSKVLTASGEPFGSNTVLKFPETQVNPSIAFNSVSKEYMVVWYDARNYPVSGYDIYGERMPSMPGPYKVYLPYLSREYAPE